MGTGSKAIGKTDDSAKEFVINLLGTEVTRGFDIDSIYYIHSTKEKDKENPRYWCVIEMLKCDKVDPFSSNPNRYSFNWKKFASLWSVAKKLEGKLYLVNYSLEKNILSKEQLEGKRIAGIEEYDDKEIRWKDIVKMMEVEDINIEKVKKSTTNYCKYITLKEYYYTYNSFKKHFRNLNSQGIGPWEE